jgi:hypothetical protein
MKVFYNADIAWPGIPGEVGGGLKSTKDGLQTTNVD